MLLLIYHHRSLHLLQRRILVPFGHWWLRLMLQTLQRLPRLASTKTERALDVLPVPIGCSCLFSFWNGCDQKANREEIPWIPSSPLYCCFFDSVFNHEQSNDCWSHDFDCSWHEWYLNGRMQGLFGNNLRNKNHQCHRLHSLALGLDFLQNLGLPILPAFKRLRECSSPHWRMVHDFIRVQIPRIYGLRTLHNALVLDLLLNEGRSSHLNKKENDQRPWKNSKLMITKLFYFISLYFLFCFLLLKWIFK